MSPTTPTSRSPRLPRQEQGSHQSYYLRPRYSSSASIKAIASSHLHTESMVGTYPSTRAGSQQADASGGVIGLPGTIDPLLDGFDLSQVDMNGELPSDFFDLEAFQWDGTYGLDMPTSDPNASQFGYNNLDDNNQIVPDPELVPVENGQYGYYSGYSDHTVVPHDQFGAGQDHLELPAFTEADVPAMLDHSNNYQHADYNFPWDPDFPLTTTPGFSAFPGGPSHISTINQQIYPDPSAATHQARPYFQTIEQQYQAPEQQYPQVYTGYTPDLTKQHYDQEQLNSTQQVRHRWSTQEMNSAPVQPKPTRKRTRLDYESEEDLPRIKRSRQDQPIQQDLSPSSDASRRQSESSSSSSLSKPVKSNVIKAGQKPKKCKDKPWVRINTTTKGETTRTARINKVTEDGPRYKIKDLPHGDWQSSNFKFEYTQNSDMHEFKKRTMPARQIHEFITEYPGNNLRIWIQVVAADSARRYASASHSHCRFEHCPMRQWNGKGTIEVGHYRVAFDEKHKTYGKGVVDPYDCVAFAHLYCMERFLDFEEICRVADVRVDERSNMVKEPKGQAAFAFGKKHFEEAAIVNKFLTAVRKGRLGDTPEFSDYPIHSEYPKGERKPHDRTLIFALFGMNLKYRARSQMRQFIVERVVRPGSFPVHRGDIEVKLVHKKIESLEAFQDFLKVGTKKDFNYSAYYDYFHPEINRRYDDIMGLRGQFISEEKAGTVTKRTGKRKAEPVESDSEGEASAPTRTRNRMAVTVIDSDDDDDFGPNYNRFEDTDPRNQQQLTSQGPRSSLRNKQRIDYTEPQDLMPQADIYTQIYGTSSGYGAASMHSQQPQTHTYPQQSHMDARNGSCSDLFPSVNDNFANYNIDDLPPPQEDEPELTQEYIDSILNSGLNRRKSSTLSNGPHTSALKSPKMTRSTRTASFNLQPVSSSKEFMKNDPPSQVATSPTISHEKDHQVRRSKRIASKAEPPASPEKGQAIRRPQH